MPAPRASLSRFIMAAALTALLPMTAFAAQPPKKPAPAAAAAQADSTDAAGADDLLAGADVERGKTVYAKVGICVSCHGWDGNGMGKNPRSEGKAALLRDTQLDTATLIEVVRCGIPGTPMPYHHSQAYKDPDLCFGQVMADFDKGFEPRRGKTFRDKDIVNVVAYIESAMKGKGKATLADCEAYFGAGNKACDFLR